MFFFFQCFCLCYNSQNQTKIYEDALALSFRSSICQCYIMTFACKRYVLSMLLIYTCSDEMGGDKGVKG